jgi:hypothetical protein
MITADLVATAVPVAERARTRPATLARYNAA